MSPKAAKPDAEALVKRAVAHRGVDRGRVKVTVSLSRAAAERLTARAIREARNLDDLLAELLERAAR